jgi:heme-degrading monooxygenase HmoA
MPFVRAPATQVLTEGARGVLSGEAPYAYEGAAMFASMRRYRLQRGSMAELARRVDEGFAGQLATQPGFVSYEFIDCGFGEFMTMSIFLTLEQAEASRELARRWADENREDLEFPRLEAAHGEILVGRAAQTMLQESHVGAARKPVAIRRYRVHEGSVAEVMRAIDGVFADRFEAMPGFEAWHVFDCGRDEIVWIDVLRDFAAAEESDERAFRFVSEELRHFELERMASLRGTLIVSRATSELLEPAHM